MPPPADRLWPFVDQQWSLGTAGSGSPMHYHNTAWNALVFGAKLWLVVPPSHALVSNLHVRAWDETERRADEANKGRPAPLECVQRRGDIVVVPELWGHAVLNLQDTIAVATEARAAEFRPPTDPATKLRHIRGRSAGGAPRQPFPRPRPPPPPPPPPPPGAFLQAPPPPGAFLQAPRPLSRDAPLQGGPGAAQPRLY